MDPVSTDPLQVDFSRKLTEIRQQIAAASERAGRDAHSVTLIAVSKMQPVEAVAAALAAGQLDFGENYAQELRDKAQTLRAVSPPARWHFIGPLQRNKVRLVVGRASLIHSVDSVALLAAIADRVRSGGPLAPPAPPAPATSVTPLPQDCLIQVNLGDEPQKAGCLAGELPALLDAFALHGGAVRCLGLMCIPPAAPPEQAERARPFFRRLRELFDEARARPRPSVQMRELSMGMSQDFSIAIEEGATLVRVGTALFGQRAVR